MLLRCLRFTHKADHSRVSGPSWQHARRHWESHCVSVQSPCKLRRVVKYEVDVEPQASLHGMAGRNFAESWMKLRVLWELLLVHQWTFGGVGQMVLSFHRQRLPLPRLPLRRPQLQRRQRRQQRRLFRPRRRQSHRPVHQVVHRWTHHEISAHRYCGSDHIGNRVGYWMQCILEQCAGAEFVDIVDCGTRDKLIDL